MFHRSLFEHLQIKRAPKKTNQHLDQIYYIKSGETLSDVAKKHNITMDELLKVNPHVGCPELIYPGQIIFLPHYGKCPGENNMKKPTDQKPEKIMKPKPMTPIKKPKSKKSYKKPVPKKMPQFNKKKPSSAPKSIYKKPEEAVKPDKKESTCPGNNPFFPVAPYPKDKQQKK